MKFSWIWFHRYNRVVLLTALSTTTFCLLHFMSLITELRPQQHYDSTTNDRNHNATSLRYDEPYNMLDLETQYKKWRLSPLMVGPFKPAFRPEEKATILLLMNTFHRMCINADITYFLYGGSLLGSFRHHDLIPWDDDIDVIVDVTQMASLLKELKKLPRGFKHFLAGARLKVFMAASKYTSEYPWRWPYLDVNFFVQNGTHVCDSSTEFKKYCYPNSAVFPLHLRPLYGLTLNAPRNTLRCLRLTYDSMDCESHYYSHKKEAVTSFKKTSFSCKRFGADLGSVKRKIIPGKGIEETLFLGNRIVHSIVVGEPTITVNPDWTYSIKAES